MGQDRELRALCRPVSGKRVPNGLVLAQGIGSLELAAVVRSMDGRFRSIGDEHLPQLANPNEIVPLLIRVTLGSFRLTPHFDTTTIHFRISDLAFV